MIRTHAALSFEATTRLARMQTSAMRQTTLAGLRKRPATQQPPVAQGGVASKRARVIVVDVDEDEKVGTAIQPIDLEETAPSSVVEQISSLEKDAVSRAAGTIEHRLEESQHASPFRGQARGGIDLEPRHEGPSTSQPLRINPPPFELSTCFTHVKPRVIKKDPDLDLLYFKTMSE